jgi:hypothetical protein
MTAFRDMALCIVRYKKTDVSEVRSASIVIMIAVMMEAVRTSETLVYFKETTQRHIP